MSKSYTASLRRRELSSFQLPPHTSFTRVFQTNDHRQAFGGIAYLNSIETLFCGHPWSGTEGMHVTNVYYKE